MGLPTQPIEEVIDTILYANALGVQVRLAVFSPIPGTKDYDRAVQKGNFPPNADPLLTNKTIIPLFRTKEAYRTFHHIVHHTQKLNASLQGKGERYSEKQFRMDLKRESQISEFSYIFWQKNRPKN